MMRSQHRALAQERLRAGGGGTSAADTLPPFHAATMLLGAERLMAFPLTVEARRSGAGGVCGAGGGIGRETPGDTTGVLSGTGSGVKSITRAQEHHSSGASSRASSQWGTPYTPVGERDWTRERLGADHPVLPTAQSERMRGAAALAQGWGTPVDVAADIGDTSAGSPAPSSVHMHSVDGSRGGAGAAGGAGRGGTEASSRRSLDYLGGL